MTPASMLRKDRSTAESRPAFQHRHFAVIARIIRDLPDEYPRFQIAQRFADELADTNPNFDRRRFIMATTPITPAKAS